MKRSFLLLMLGLFCYKPGSSQVISRFTWDGPGATPLRADIGPDAISVNSSTVVSVIGSTAGVSNGALNAGSVAHRDINLTLPNNPIFNIPSIDVWVNFRREETGASFYTRGSSFDFGLNGSQLFITFSVQNGSGGSTVVNSGPIYAIPDDHIFHNYRFLYDNATGRGYVWVDGVTRYTYNGTPGRDLVWTNTNPIVGNLMDGTARNLGVLDHFELRLFSPAVLPLGFGNFSTVKKSDHVLLNWTILNAANLSHFVVERSLDGTNFEAVHRVNAKRASLSSSQYELTHFETGDLFEKVSFRIRSVDHDGNSIYSEIRVVSFKSSATTLTAYPNPADGYLNLVCQVSTPSIYIWTLYTPDGREVMSGTKFLERGKQNFRVEFTRSVPSQTALILTLAANGQSTEKTTPRVLRQ